MTLALCRAARVTASMIVLTAVSDAARAIA